MAASNLAGSSPTNLSSVNFTVSFSEAVTGVKKTDFSLTVSGLTGASVSTVSGSGATRTVTVNSGSGHGSLRLNVLPDSFLIDWTKRYAGAAGEA